MVHQEDCCHRRRDLNVDGIAQMGQNILEARALGDHFKRPLFGGTQQFRLLEVIDVSAGSVLSDDFGGLVAYP